MIISDEICPVILTVKKDLKSCGKMIVIKEENIRPIILLKNTRKKSLAKKIRYQTQEPYYES